MLAGYYNQRQYNSFPQAILLAVTIPILATWGGGWGGYQPGYWGGGYGPGEAACLRQHALLTSPTCAALSVSRSRLPFCQCAKESSGRKGIQLE